MSFARRVLRRRRAIALLVSSGAASATIGCLGVESPPEGIASLSAVQLPAPSVVVGDSMRDSTGAAAPLRVYAFGPAGDTLAGVPVSFVVLDPGAHVDSAGFVVGDSVKDSVRVVANLGATGSVQSIPAGIRVTIAPNTFAAPATRDTFFFNAPPPTDSMVVSAAAGTNGLRPTATDSVSKAGANGFIVSYELIHAPAGRTPDVVGGFVGDASSRKAMTRDTTDRTGTAVRRSLILDFNKLPASWRFDTTVIDSFVVKATLQRRGYPVADSTATWTVVVRPAAAR